MSTSKRQEEAEKRKFAEHIENIGELAGGQPDHDPDNEPRRKRKGKDSVDDDDATTVEQLGRIAGGASPSRKSGKK